MRKFLALFLLVPGLVFAQAIAPPATTSDDPWTTRFGGAALKNTTNGVGLLSTSQTPPYCFTFFDNQDGAHICWDGSVAQMDATGTSVFAGVSLSAGKVSAPNSEFLVAYAWLNAAASASTLGGHKLGAGQGANVNAVTLYVSAVGGGGGGSTTFRISDGTNNCDAAFLCTTTNSTGIKRVDTTGTCTFAASAALTMSITASTCTTTQPTIKNVDWVGGGS